MSFVEGREAHIGGNQVGYSIALEFFHSRTYPEIQT